MPLDLLSPEFEDGDPIPSKYTCDGEDVNPPLQILDIPEEAESLVLVVYDTDSPDGDFVHWLLWNIPPNTTKIAEGELPLDAVEGYNDFGDIGYAGPCPHAGEHHYHFHLYALDTEMELDEDATRQKLEKEISGHILDEVQLIGTYRKQD